jgi:hypothetical protein
MRVKRYRVDGDIGQLARQLLRRSERLLRQR